MYILSLLLLKHITHPFALAFKTYNTISHNAIKVSKCAQMSSANQKEKEKIHLTLSQRHSKGQQKIT